MNPLRRPGLLAAALTAALLLAPAAWAQDDAAQETGFAREVGELTTWIERSGDNRRLPFVIVDKVNARAFAFDGKGRLLGDTAVLLGLSKGDDSAAGIGERKLSQIAPADRTTPAGRFEAVLGHDFDQDILWVDYASALSLHRVIVGNPRDHRARRLASATPDDNRISYGCINVPAAFYDGVIVPAFTGGRGIVYILPETRPAHTVFAMARPLKARTGN